MGKVKCDILNVSLAVSLDKEALLTTGSKAIAVEVSTEAMQL